MTKRRKRRVWSDDEKRVICGQTRVPGVPVSQVARRYDVNANLVFAWLCDPRFAHASAADVARFLPVEIVAEAKAPVALPARRGSARLGVEPATGFGCAPTPDGQSTLARPAVQPKNA